MTKLVQNLDSVIAAILDLNEKLPQYPLLVDRLAQAHAFYVYESENKEPLFGFSKYVGYQNLTPEKYLNKYKNLNGRNTEHVLKKWFEEVKEGSPAYDRLFEKLSAWLGEYGKRPREGAKQSVRIMIVRPEYREPDDTKAEERALLDLLITVANTLPASQRHELRATL